MDTHDEIIKIDDEIKQLLESKSELIKSLIASAENQISRLQTRLNELDEEIKRREGKQ